MYSGPMFQTRTHPIQYQHVIMQVEVTEAWKTLGVKTAPTGDNTAQFEHMLEVSQKWAAQIKARNLRQIDAWLAL
jgi:hypothetical protein